MKIIEEYKRLTEEIAVAESKLESARRELKKQVDQYKPSDLKAIDYSNEKVQTSVHQQDMVETYDIIEEIKDNIKLTEKDLIAVKSQRKKIEDVINDIGGRHKQVLMLMTKGERPVQIAEKMGVDIRHVFRLLSQSRDKIEK